jgi:transposase-like protein
LILEGQEQARLHLKSKPRWSYQSGPVQLLDRGVEVDHTTIFRWIQAYAEELEKRIRPHLPMSNGSWRVDETYVRVKGRWMYLYRAVDSRVTRHLGVRIRTSVLEKDILPDIVIR